MSDKYNQIKQTWKIKLILNEAANDWKQSYGCYPTVKEFINLINEHSSVLPNTSNILVEDRLITSNDITWLSETIINEQAVGEDKINAWSDKQTEDFINANPGAEEKVRGIRDRYKRAQADNASAARGERANAERTGAEAAAKAEAEKTAKDRSAQEAAKAAEAKGRTDRVSAPPSAAAPAQERVRVTPEEAAKATDWRTRSSDPAERIRQKEASDAERARARQAARPASSSPSPAAKTSFGDRMYTAADEFGNKIFTGLETAANTKIGRAANTTGKFAVRLPGGLAGAIPMVAGGYLGGKAGEAVGGTSGRIAGEVAGSYLGNNATYLGAEMLGKGIRYAASKTIPQGVQNAGKAVAGGYGAVRNWLPWSDVLRVPPKDGPGLTKRNWLSGGGAAGMVAAGAGTNWVDEKAQELSPAYKAWAEANPKTKIAAKLAVDLPLMTAGAKLGNMATKAATPVVTNIATKIAPKAMGWAAKNIAPKIGKYVPVLGLAAAGTVIGLGAQRAYAGDPVGGGLEMVSGGAALIPGVGIPISGALDAVGAYRDMSPEDRKVVNQIAKDTVNIPKQAAAFARGITPSALSVPQESEEEKQRIRMLDSDNEPKNPKRKLQPVNEQKVSVSPAEVKIITKEILDVLAKKLDTTIAREVPGVLEKEAVRVPFEIPSYTNHPITVANPNRSSKLKANPISFDPIDPITLPTAASPTITTTNTSTATGIQIGTTTFPIPKMAAPTLPATKAVPTLPATKTKTKTKAKTSTLTDVKTTTDPAIKTDPGEKTVIPIPLRGVIGTIDPSEDDNSQNNFTRFDSTASDPSLPDFDANTERLHARKGTYLPQYNQNTGRFFNIAQTIQINEKRDSDLPQELTPEDTPPRLRGIELGARKSVSMPYWDQGSQSYRFMAHTVPVGIQESRSGTLNTKSALQARAKKQRYKVTVMENGKKLEVFATSIRGIRRVVYGKKNFRVHDGKGADITNYFKRLMSSNKST